jgi:ribosomal protein S27E
MAVRKSDIIEMIGERSISFALGGIVAGAIGLLIYQYRVNQWGEYTVGLAWTLMVGGALMILASLYSATQVRKVTGFRVKCPYCSAKNTLVEPPKEDFLCISCNREIPVEDGNVLPVFQVRCGYCNELNFYNAKTEVLICEKCDHEVPITQEDGRATKHVPKGYAVTDDDRLYELVLIGHGHKTEELINALQHMLALNRGQVKQLLNELPATLLTGITRKKAEMLQAQLSIHDGAAEFHPIQT